MILLYAALKAVLSCRKGLLPIRPHGQAPSLSGLFRGRLDFVCNKHDFDLEIDLIEYTATGQYIQLSYLKTRASYLLDSHLTGMAFLVIYRVADA